MASNDSAAAVRRHFAVAQRNNWLPLFAEASRDYGVPVEILLAIASRETSMGTFGLRADGSNGRGMVGIMQLNRRYHPVRGTDHRAVIRRAAWYLAGELRRTFTAWNYRLAGYNAGPYGGVRTAFRRGRSPDPYTDGRNYPTDVLRRAAIMRAELAASGGAQAQQAALVVVATESAVVGGSSSLAPVVVATDDPIVPTTEALVGIEDWSALAVENAALLRDGTEITPGMLALGLAAGAYLLFAK